MLILVSNQNLNIMRTIIGFAAALFFLSSCNSLTPFTQDMYSDLNLATEEIKSVQFYLSQDIVLYKDVNTDEARVENGRIKLKERHKSEQVIIRSGTPGVVIFMPKQNRFAVSFENDDDKFLIFGPNERQNERYTLLGKDWSRDGFGKVTYGGQEYTTSTRNAMASLMVNINKMNTTTVKTKEVNGRKVGDE